MIKSAFTLTISDPEHRGGKVPKQLQVQTPADVAVAKGVTRQAVFQAVRNGALRSVKLGTRVYIVVDALYEAYMETTPGQRRDLK